MNWFFKLIYKTWLQLFEFQAEYCNAVKFDSSIRLNMTLDMNSDLDDSEQFIAIYLFCFKGCSDAERAGLLAGYLFRVRLSDKLSSGKL